MPEFLKDAKFWISVLLIGPAWFVVCIFWQSNTHMILGTNVISAVAGYWIGSSISSSDKNATLLKIKENSNEVQKVNTSISNPPVVD